MQHALRAVLIGAALCVATAAAAVQATPSACPVPDVSAAIAQACKCDGFRNHGQYMKCVRKEVRALRKQGCNVAKLARCASTSICSKPHAPIVCCNSNRHAKITTAAKCTAKGGQVMTGATSLCNAGCTTP